MEISVSKDLIAPFVAAVEETFSTMVGFNVQKEGVYISEIDSLEVDVSGVMGITGNINGNITISFPQQLAIRAVSSMLGDSLNSLDDTVCDGVGELKCVINPGFRSEWAKQGELAFDSPAEVHSCGASF